MIENIATSVSLDLDLIQQLGDSPDPAVILSPVYSNQEISEIVDFRFIYANSLAQCHFGHELREIKLSSLFTGIVISEKETSHFKIFKNAYLNGLPQQYRRTSLYQNHDFIATIVKHKNYLVVFWRDVPQLSKSRAPTVNENAIVYHENLFRHFVNAWHSAQVGFILADHKGKCLQVSPSFARLVGYMPEELINFDSSLMTHPEDRRIGEAEFNSLIQGKIDKYKVEKRYRRKDGTVFLARVIASRFAGFGANSEPLILGIIEDIQDLSDTQKKLRKNESLLRRLLDDLPIAVCACENDGQIIFANKMLLKYLQVENSYFEYGLLDDIVRKNQKVQLNKFKATLQGEKFEESLVDLEIKCGDGTYKWFRLRGHRLQTDDTIGISPIGVVIFRDLDKERQLSEKLSLTEEKLKSVVDTNFVILFSFDLSGKITFITGAPLKEINVEAHQIMGHSIFDLLQDNSPALEAVFRSLEGVPHSALVKLNDRWFDVYLSPVFDDFEFGRFCRINAMAFDVTDREIARQEIDIQKITLIKTAKLAAIGQMAAGISHEIHNPLTVIYGYACALKNLIEQHKTDFSYAPFWVDEIIKTSKRIENIIDGLRAFAHESVGETPESIKIGEIISDTLTFCEQRIREGGIALKITNNLQDSRVIVRPVQVAEIVLNLMNNAYDAVQNETTDRWIEVGCNIVNIVDGACELYVRNSGQLISAEVREHLFEPFYTTKSTGRGTGLGLSISKGLAEVNKGALWLDTNDEYTTFKLKLPLDQNEY